MQENGASTDQFEECWGEALDRVFGSEDGDDGSSQEDGDDGSSQSEDD